MERTIARSMMATMVTAMIAGGLTACGGSDSKTESATAVKTMVEAPESVEETTVEAADTKETTEAADAEEPTEAIDTGEPTEAADAEGSIETADVEGSTEASKEEAASEADAKVAEEITKAAQD